MSVPVPPNGEPAGPGPAYRGPQQDPTGYPGQFWPERPGGYAGPVPAPAPLPGPVVGAPGPRYEGPTVGGGPMSPGPQWSTGHPGQGVQRPAAVGTASTLAVTASLLFLCGLGLLWLSAYGLTQAIDPTGSDSVVYHLAERFQLRLGQGLVVPLVGFPLAGLVVGLMLPTRRAWIRIAFTATGAAAVLWSAWLLRVDLAWWVPVLVYVGLSCAILWTRSVSRWYADGAGPDGRHPDRVGAVAHQP